MEKIIVGFSRPKKWKPFAAAIMSGYGINYSHVYVKIRSEKYDRTLIYQASQSVVNFVGSVFFDTDNIVVEEFELDISAEGKIKLMQFAIDKAGTPYGMKEAIGLGYVRICQLFGIKKKNPFSDGEHTYVCSGLVAQILKENFDMKNISDTDDFTPKDVYMLLTSLKSAVV